MTLSTTGIVHKVEGGRALVKFPTLTNKNAGSAWFQLENVNEGDTVKVIR